MTLEILVLRNPKEIGTGVPLFERSEFGYGCQFLLDFSQKIVSLDFFASFFYQEKKKESNIFYGTGSARLGTRINNFYDLERVIFALDK